MKRYDSINGLKGLSIIMIILIHVAENGQYNLPGLAFEIISTKLSAFIELFFMISAFGMCCGYYEKIKGQKINLNNFYCRRYSRIVPFFALIILADLVFSGITSKNLLDGILNLTLMFGFMPNSQIQIVGVGWTLGVIFAFYCLFPFFVFLLWNKKRAWFVLALNFIVRWCCVDYFKADGSLVMSNLMTWFGYFLIGGIIYLYREEIERIFLKTSYVLLVIALIIMGAYVVLYSNNHDVPLGSQIIMVAFAVLMMYAISVKKSLLCTKGFQFVGKKCLEIYLSHMLVFRVLEKVHLTGIFSKTWLSFSIACVLVLIGTLVISVIYGKVYSVTIKKVNQIRENRQI